jgi:hypothetical protein
VLPQSQIQEGHNKNIKLQTNMPYEYKYKDPQQSTWKQQFEQQIKFLYI